MADVTMHLDDDLYEKATKIARLDNLSVEMFLQDILKRHVDYVATVNEFADMPPLTLESYELQRDPDETDDEYSFRRSLFR